MMKMKNIRILVAALAVLAASCQKEGVRTLTATFEQFDNGSKAYIDDEYYACWEHDDAVAVNGTTCAVTLTTGGGHANSAEITIPGTFSGENLLAFYPAGKITDMDAAGGTVDFPHIQTYRENADGKQIIDNPMAAYCPSDGEELKFRNLGSLLKVTIPNNEDIKAIQVKGIDNQMLCGKAQLRFDNNGDPSLTSCTGGSSSVTLRFPEAVRANGKSFYIVLPPNTNFETLTIAVLSNAGTAWATHAKTTYMGRGLLRNQIAAFSYDLSHHEDYDFVADWTIRYSATARVESSTPDWGTFVAEEAAYNFSGSKGLIVFDDIITKIGSNAFRNCSALLSISIPTSVTEIGNYVFYQCASLTTVSLPDATTIGYNVFYQCTNLTTVSLPGATTIGYDAFRSCASLTTVSLPSATTIGMGVFRNCTSLITVSLPNATMIGENAFYQCTNLTTVSLPNVTTIGEFAFRESGLTSLSLPSATTIERDAFLSCASLTMVSLPSATTIGGDAFRYCTKLTTIELPNVTTIGEYAFEGCGNLSHVYSKTQAPTIKEHAFKDVPTTSVLHLPSSLSGTTWPDWPGQYAYDYND